MANRTFELTTPLGKDALLFHGLTASEELGRLGDFQLDVLSDKVDIALDKILGQRVTVKMELPEDKSRYFTAYVVSFSQAGMLGRYHRYFATLKPWLWFLTRTADSRIFQEQTAPQIIKKIFEECPLADFKLELTGTYRTREYCVQYRETDFNFVSRLMEEEGIYYYFRYTESNCTLVLADSKAAHSPFPGYKELRYIPPDAVARPEEEYVAGWELRRSVLPGKYVIDDYDFQKPSVELQTNTLLKREYSNSDSEIYDYPGGYLVKGDGEHYVQTRLEELQAQFDIAHASSDARGIAIGHLLTLTNHPRKDQNREYLITAATHSLQSNQYESGDAGGAEYHGSFTAMPSKEVFRTPRNTPHPVVQGPQTAIVVGPSGDEIYTDKYGRVKVQFHWDRLGKKNENSSCFMRVSHPWAGKNWGMIAIPRIGQEVIVDFLEGNPDLPIITGRVYNAEQMPPYDLPANMTQTGIKTRSSKGGSGANFNEIRFEDKKGSEQLFIHAEKNQDIEVENDETHWVGHDRKKTIDNDETTHVKHDRTETVDNNETITIHANRTEVVDKEETITIHGGRTEVVDKEEKITISGGRTEDVAKDESITIGGNRTEKVAKDESITISGGRTENVSKDEKITISGGRTENVSKDESITIGGGRTENVSKDEKITIGGGRTESVAKDESITISGGRTENVSKDESVTISGGRTVNVSKDDSLTVGKNLKINASDSITITTGSASITMKKDGTITIKGKDVTIQGSGKINVKADSDVVVKGSKVGIN